MPWIDWFLSHYFTHVIWVNVAVTALWWWFHRNNPTCGGTNCICIRVAITFLGVFFCPLLVFPSMVCRDPTDAHTCPPRR